MIATHDPDTALSTIARLRALLAAFSRTGFDADARSLDAWLDRVFDVPDLQAVFAEPGN